MLYRITAALCAVAGLSVPVSAQQDAAFSLELNTAIDTETADGPACNIVFRAMNNGPTALESVSHVVTLYDAEDVFMRSLLLNFGAFDEVDTRTVQFLVSKATCDGIGSIVINEVDSCIEAGTKATLDRCKKGLKPSSRTAIRFYD